MHSNEMFSRILWALISWIRICNVRNPFWSSVTDSLNWVQIWDGEHYDVSVRWAQTVKWWCDVSEELSSCRAFLFVFWVVFFSRQRILQEWLWTGLQSRCCADRRLMEPRGWTTDVSAGLQKLQLEFWSTLPCLIKILITDQMSGLKTKQTADGVVSRGHCHTKHHMEVLVRCTAGLNSQL